MIMKVQSITKHCFMKGKQNISSEHEIICSVVSLFLLFEYIGTGIQFDYK